MKIFTAATWTANWRGGAINTDSSISITLNDKTLGGSMTNTHATRYGSFCADISFTYWKGTCVAFYLTSDDKNGPGWDEIDIEFIQKSKPGYSSNFFQGGRQNQKYLTSKKRRSMAKGGRHCIHWNFEKYGKNQGTVIWTFNRRELRRVSNYFGRNSSVQLHPRVSYWTNTKHEKLANWMGWFTGVPRNLVAKYDNIVYVDRSDRSQRRDYVQNFTASSGLG